jgi:hypothetical protein
MCQPWHPARVSERIHPRPPARAPTTRLRGFAPLLLVLALALAGGLLGDAVGQGHRIDLLSPPFLAVLAWNATVYVLLALGALRGTASAPARARQALDWARLLHAGAAALALGLCLGLYARGLVFDYRAGWQSTFLDAPQVHALLATVLAPASMLTGIAVPGVDGIAALRLAAGEAAQAPAAHWIHLFAVTLALFVVLPRALLAAWAATRARRLDARSAAAAAAPPTGPTSTAGALLHVLPHGLPPPDRAALSRALAATIDLAPAVPFGAEAEATLPAHHRLHVLVSLAATPEGEHHGVLMDRLRTASPTLLVDESAYAARFQHDPSRIEERRGAWRSFAAAHGAGVRFIDLGGA